MQMRVWLFSSSISTSLCVLLAAILLDFNGDRRMANAQEPVFELPVQLVGFPVIILAVRLSNFVKKLQYSLNPQTYKSRARREITYDTNEYYPETDISISKQAVDVSLAEKQILQELGPKACVMEEPCRIHAARLEDRGAPPDWNDILRHYKVQSIGQKQWYLLSVFLGDVIRDVPLCKQLAKRLRCGRDEKPFVRD